MPKTTKPFTYFKNLSKLFFKIIFLIYKCTNISKPTYRSEFRVDTFIFFLIRYFLLRDEEVETKSLQLAISDDKTFSVKTEALSDFFFENHEKNYMLNFQFQVTISVPENTLMLIAVSATTASS